jgi:S1-C subfamily serine protease
MPRAQHQAKAYCEAEGKEPFVLDSAETNSWHGPLVTVRAACIRPEDLTHTTDAFGALLLADVDIKGAQVLKVVPGSIADRAGLHYPDVVFEYEGRPIETAAALQSAVANTNSGSPVLLRVHRNQKEVLVHAQF